MKFGACAHIVWMCVYVWEGENSLLEFVLRGREQATPVWTFSKYCSCRFFNPDRTLDSPGKLKNTDVKAL